MAGSSPAASWSTRFSPRTPLLCSGDWAPRPPAHPREVTLAREPFTRNATDILGERRPPWGFVGSPFLTSAAPVRAAFMQEITEQPTTASEAADGLAAAALRAEAWAGEPFIREGEDPARVLAPDTSRRRALDDALAEIEAGRRTPSPQWKVQYGLMLGLERVLAEQRPHLASGTELRRHQVDALAGMLTELIASHEKEANGNGAAIEAVQEEDEPEEDSNEDVLDEEEEDQEYAGPDPGAIRRYRFRHPTASGKTIAAARTLGVLILTHRRLLVSQFQRDLTTEGYGDRFSPPIEREKEPLRGGNPLTIQTYAWFARHQDTLSREAYQLVICDEAHTALGEKTSSAIRSFPEPIYIG